MNFAPQKRIAVARTTGFVVSSRSSPCRFQFTSPLPETSCVFSTTSELFARFWSARPLFSTICGLFCQKWGGGVPPVWIFQSEDVGLRECRLQRVRLESYLSISYPAVECM